MPSDKLTSTFGPNSTRAPATRERGPCPIRSWDDRPDVRLRDAHDPVVAPAGARVVHEALLAQDLRAHQEPPVLAGRECAPVSVRGAEGIEQGVAVAQVALGL